MRDCFLSDSSWFKPAYAAHIRRKLWFHEKPIVASRKRIRPRFFGCFWATGRKRRLRHGIHQLTHLPAPNRRCNRHCSRPADSRQDRSRREFTRGENEINVSRMNILKYTNNHLYDIRLKVEKVKFNKLNFMARKLCSYMHWRYIEVC